MSGQSGDVVVLFPSAEATEAAAPLRKRPRDWDRPRPDCHGRHTRCELDQDEHRVYCRDCKAEVTAFDALARLADDFERYVTTRRAAAAEVRRLEKRAEDLKREERNTKARLRRATA